MSDSIVAIDIYIDTASRSKHGQRAYGFRVLKGEQELARGLRLTGSNQPVTAQMLALRCVLQAFGGNTAIQGRIILPSQYLRSRLDMAGNRSFNRQRNVSMRDMRECEEEWEETYNLFNLHSCGIRQPRTTQDDGVMREIARELMKKVNGFVEFTPEEKLDPEIVIEIASGNG